MKCNTSAKKMIDFEMKTKWSKAASAVGNRKSMVMSPGGRSRGKSNKHDAVSMSDESGKEGVDKKKVGSTTVKDLIRNNLLNKVRNASAVSRKANDLVAEKERTNQTTTLSKKEDDQPNLSTLDPSIKNVIL